MGAMDVLDRLHINLIRLCKNRNAGDVGCEGNSNKSEDCIRGLCGFWSTWTSCSNSCGKSSKNRYMICRNGVAGDEGCEGVSDEVELCNVPQLCPQWLSWSDCSQICEGGMWERSPRRSDGLGLHSVPRTRVRRRSLQWKSMPILRRVECLGVVQKIGTGIQGTNLHRGRRL